MIPESGIFREPKPTFRRIFGVIDKQRKIMLARLVVYQFLLSVLDFFSILLIGLIGAISVSELTRTPVSERLSSYLDTFESFSSYQLKYQIAILLITSISIFTLKSILSILITHRVMQILGDFASLLSSIVLSRTLKDASYVFSSKKRQERVFATTRGVDYLCLFVIAPCVILVADFATLIIFVLGLFVLDPFVTLSITLTVVFMSFFSMRRLQNKSNKLGSLNAELNVKSNQRIFESLEVFRELVVRDARDFYTEDIRRIRAELAKNTAVFNTIPYIAKYSMEFSIVLVGVVLAFLFSVKEDLTAAITILILFTAASARITPTILRAQQSLISIKGNLGIANSTLQILEDLKLDFLKSNKGISPKLFLDMEVGFQPRIEMKNVGFRHQNQEQFQIIDMSLTIEPGEEVAFVGPSGSGKTTTVDLILGVLKPTTGEVLISGLNPEKSFAQWPRMVAYVPQRVGVVSGSIRENLALGFEVNEFSDSSLLDALEKANLREFVELLSEGLDTNVDEHSLSMGQKQRLGLARAFLTKPQLIVLDECTSSLDSNSEREVTNALGNLGGHVTRVVVAHRLSTIINFKRIVYFDKGEIVQEGTFEELRSKIPKFDSHAKLMGL